MTSSGRKEFDSVAKYLRVNKRLPSQYTDDIGLAGNLTDNKPIVLVFLVNLKEKEGVHAHNS